MVARLFTKLLYATYLISRNAISHQEFSRRAWRAVCLSTIFIGWILFPEHASAQHIIETVAGIGYPGYDVPQPSAGALLNYPSGVFVAKNGDIYIADAENHRIRKVDAESGAISTVAGREYPGYGGDGELAIFAVLNEPRGVFVTDNGDIYIADTGNHRIRKVDGSTGVITSIVGTGEAGFNGNGQRAFSAQLNRPHGVFVKSNNDVYIADTSNHLIRRYNVNSGRVNGVAGTGAPGFNGDDQFAASAHLHYPINVFIAEDGYVYIADRDNHRIRRVDEESQYIYTVAGTGIPGFNGDDQQADSALLNFPQGLFVDSDGDIYIADTANHRIRRVEAESGLISTVAGNGTQGFNGDDQPAANASMRFPRNLFVTGDGDIYIADEFNHRIRRVDGSSGIITTVSGTGEAGFDVTNLPADSVPINLPLSLFVTEDGSLYFSDAGNNLIRRMDGVNGHISTLAGIGIGGFNGDNQLAKRAQVRVPRGIYIVERTGDMYIADMRNHRIRRVDGTTGIITTVAGTGESGFNGDDLPATSAYLYFPNDVFVSDNGDIYIADSTNHRVRKVDAESGLITTVAGMGVAGFQGDNQLAKSAHLNYPSCIFVEERTGDIYISDTYNHRIRRVDGSNGIITTVAGTDLSGYNGDLQLATRAHLHFPQGIFVTSIGDIYIADSTNHRVRRVDGETGLITTVAGNGIEGFNGDGLTASIAQFSYPYDVFVTGNGDVYIADSYNNRIRRVYDSTQPTPTPTSTSTPTPEPTATPTPTFTLTPTPVPTATPTPTPTLESTSTPTPTATPSATSTPEPSPTLSATSTPSATPTPTPTSQLVPTPTTGVRGVDELILAQGAGGVTQVQTRNLDLNSGEPLLGLLNTFRGLPLGFVNNVGGGADRGVYVSTGDVNGDGQMDIVLSFGPITDAASFPNLIYTRDGRTREVNGAPFSIFPHNNPATFINYPYGELRTAVGDFLGAGKPQIAVAQGTGSNGVIRLVMHDSDSPSGWRVVAQFLGITDVASNVISSAYSDNADGGVTVAAGDLTGDGRDELIVGQTNSVSSNARFQVIRFPETGGAGVVVDEDLHRFQFNAFGTGVANIGNGGVNLAVGDMNGDGRNEVIAASMGNSRDHGDARDAAQINLISIRKPVITGGQVTGFSVAPGSLFNVLTESQNPSGALSIATGEFDGDPSNGQELVVGTGAIFEYDPESRENNAILPAPVNRFYLFKANYNEDGTAITSITNLLQRLSDPASEGRSNSGRQAFIGYLDADGNGVEMNPASGALSVAAGNAF